jgi:hypothetical protein
MSNPIKDLLQELLSHKHAALNKLHAIAREILSPEAVDVAGSDIPLAPTSSQDFDVNSLISLSQAIKTTINSLLAALSNSNITRSEFLTLMKKVGTLKDAVSRKIAAASKDIKPETVTYLQDILPPFHYHKMLTALNGIMKPDPQYGEFPSDIRKKMSQILSVRNGISKLMASVAEETGDLEAYFDLHFTINGEENEERRLSFLLELIARHLYANTFSIPNSAEQLKDIYSHVVSTHMLFIQSISSNNEEEEIEKTNKIINDALSSSVTVKIKDNAILSQNNNFRYAPEFYSLLSDLYDLASKKNDKDVYSKGKILFPSPSNKSYLYHHLAFFASAIGIIGCVLVGVYRILMSTKLYYSTMDGFLEVNANQTDYCSQQSNGNVTGQWPITPSDPLDACTQYYKDLESLIKACCVGIFSCMNSNTTTTNLELFNEDCWAFAECDNDYHSAIIIATIIPTFFMVILLVSGMSLSAKYCGTSSPDTVFKNILPILKTWGNKNPAYSALLKPLMDTNFLKDSDVRAEARQHIGDSLVRIAKDIASNPETRIDMPETARNTMAPPPNEATPLLRHSIQ